ncbi:MAG TPA: hypothetical protein VFX70_11395 [Mycobacteriales bacterium]|nr:hypothetical protein [Mycobacteriales bacterium]
MRFSRENLSGAGRFGRGGLAGRLAGMVVMIGWAVAVFVALLVFAALVLGLRGHVTRFRRAADSAASELTPALGTLRANMPDPRGNP